ncbi:beta-arabinofuranosyltransferase RAY1 [Trifolium repens]|nr:beta-arabinofuranosyltransferase RAY1 [Trifolium repens]
MSVSTKTRPESKAVAKEATEGCWLYKTTLTNGDSASQDRTASDCLVPIESIKGLGAVNMVMLRFVEYKTSFFLSLKIV